MVTIGGGNVTVGDAGAGEQAARMIERRETIKVVRSIRELYCLKVTVTHTYRMLRKGDCHLINSVLSTS